MHQSFLFITKIKAEDDLKKIHAKDMPVVVIAAPKDPIVQLNISKGVMSLVGITEEDRLTYTEEKTWHPADRKRYSFSF